MRTKTSFSCAAGVVLLAALLGGGCGGDAGTEVDADRGTEIGADAGAEAADGGDRYTLTVALSGNGRGAVTSAPAGVDCGADCSEAVPAKTAVRLHAAPESGSA